MLVYPIKNRQRRTAFISLLISLLSIAGFILPFREGSKLEGAWALVFISFFICISGLAVAWIFFKRAKKMDALISGTKLVISWQLGADEKGLYTKHLYETEKGRNKIILSIIAITMTLAFGFVIFAAEKGRLGLFAVYLGIMAIILLFAFGMPEYYRKRNSKADGYILIGKKFAYINGVFHNWDFPLSGIKSVKIIQQPFRGLRLSYYYTDRTLRNEETIDIPANSDIDLESVIRLLSDKAE